MIPPPTASVVTEPAFVAPVVQPVHPVPVTLTAAGAGATSRFAGNTSVKRTLESARPALGLDTASTSVVLAPVCTEGEPKDLAMRGRASSVRLTGPTFVTFSPW